mmetsp:Transcript_112/g.240  ORF Transcript_112/g.240 Transcript_112/m.240 type:complete len:116 (-) Transcript_112:13-360(-)
MYFFLMKWIQKFFLEGSNVGACVRIGIGLILKSDLFSGDFFLFSIEIFVFSIGFIILHIPHVDGQLINISDISLAGKPIHNSISHEDKLPISKQDIPIRFLKNRSSWQDIVGLVV